MAKRTAAGTLALAVCLSGGAMAFAGAAHASSGFKFNAPIAGATRYDTAIAAADKMYPNGSDNAVVVNAHSTVDGLTASYIAGLHNAPILYTDTDVTPDKTVAELQKLKVKNIYVVGGTSVVSQKQIDTWKGLGLSVTTYGGATRYETAALAADAGGKQAGAFVASGDNAHLADALAVGPVAFASHMPILLTQADSTPSVTTDEIAKLGAKVTVVGGTTAVSASQVSSLGAGTALAGSDRGATADLVADWAIANAGFSKTGVALVGSANGNAADALVASPVAGTYKIPVLFAGLTSSNKYLSDHASSLTGTGEVFGGPAAVSSDAIAAATSAAVGSVTTSQGYTVTNVTYKSTGAFQYADTSAKQAATASFTSSDSFTIDGVKASIGAFRTALTAGDTVIITSNGGGTSTYALTNVTVTSGLVGDVDENSSDTTLAILDPTTGASIASYNYAPPFALYTVDGASVTKATFEANLNEGDSIAVTGGDGSTAAKIQTFALANKTVSGVVDAIASSSSAPAITINTGAGFSLGDLTSAAQTSTAATAMFTVAAGDTLTVDGASVGASDFNTALSAGDKITYSRSGAGGHATFALTNQAPVQVSGTLKGISNGVVTYYTGVGSTMATTTDIRDATLHWTIKVNGVVSTAADLAAAATAGDTVVVQNADSTTSTTPTISLTDQSLVGRIKQSSVAGASFDVFYGDTYSPLATSIDSSASTDPIYGNTSLKYYVNGTSNTSAQFVSALSLVGNGTKLGTIQIVNNDGVTEYRLTSVANTAAAKIVAISQPTSYGSITVTFSKPVYLAGTAAGTDFVISKTTSSSTSTLVYAGASPTTAATASRTVVLSTLSSATWTTGDSISVQLTDTGAAKFLDANGTAAVGNVVVGP